MPLTKKQETIIKKWVTALRSGKYKQGKDFLRTENDEYCCLGVLCELAVMAKVLEKPIFLDTKWVYENNRRVLPRKVKIWAGLNHPDGSFVEGGTLAAINDNGTKFPAIAKLIESKPEGLFV